MRSKIKKFDTYGSIGTKIEENLSDGEQHDEKSGRKIKNLVVSDTENNEHGSKHNKSHDLDELAAKPIYSEYGDPVTRNGTE
jgi:hypothetical protein